LSFALTPEPSSTGRLRVGVDTGGTFTDLVAVEEQTGRRHVVKVSSTPGRPADAVFEALRRLPAAPADLGFFVLGTTIATNCLLQRTGQRTLYLTTAGFEDIPFIQRIDRKGLHDLQWVKPLPYVLRRDCIGVRERVTHDGSVRTPLAETEIERIVEVVTERDRGAGDGVAVAINFLFAYAAPEHERRLAAALRAALPHIPVSASSEVAPLWREYERANTVIVDAYLKRLVGGFAREIGTGLAKLDIDCPAFVLKSNGGQLPTHAAARQPSNIILSGLAGGLIAGKYFADATGRSDAFTVDMGGTSCDVGVVVGGAIQSRQQYEFEWGLPIAVPVVDLTTIGAGGSSIASFDLGGLLKVGPESAGARPGPAAYGQGGTAPTVTDANLVLGRLNPDYFLGGEILLDGDAAHRALEPLAERLRLSLEHAALAVLDMAVENMANAIRLLAADRGIDYRRFDLIAFGGAGPLHAGDWPASSCRRARASRRRSERSRPTCASTARSRACSARISPPTSSFAAHSKSSHATRSRSSSPRASCAHRPSRSLSAAGTWGRTSSKTSSCRSMRPATSCALPSSASTKRTSGRTATGSIRWSSLCTSGPSSSSRRTLHRRRRQPG
jgi:N-methylhydantoinase A